ncbi:MAG: 2TM domain-containing protein [Bacteroidota bacterium]
MEDRQYKLAKRRVEKKKGFYVHLGVYIAVGVFFFIINLVTMDQEPQVWFFYPMIPWLIAIMIHYFTVFGLPGTDILTEDWEEREIEKEINKIQQSSPFALPPEQTENFKLDDLPKAQKEEIKRGNWQNEDFV